MGVLWDRAVGLLWADVREEVEVEGLVGNDWIRGEAPIQIEVARFVQLRDFHGEVGHLLVEVLFRPSWEVGVDDALTEHLESMLKHVASRVRELADEPLAELVWREQLRVAEVDSEVVKLWIEVTVRGRLKTRRHESIHIIEVDLHLSFEGDTKDSILIAKSHLPVLDQRDSHVNDWLAVDFHIREVE